MRKTSDVKRGRKKSVTNRPRKNGEGSYPRLPRDFYPEPIWCADALFREEQFDGLAVFDPFCGTGRVLDGAKRHGKVTTGRDIHPLVKKRNGHDVQRGDSVKRGMFIRKVSTVTNPPFIVADELLRQMVHYLDAKHAIFMRLSALQGKSKLLEKLPLSMVWVLRPRPACLPPDYKLRPPMKDSGGQIDFCWYVFDPKYRGAPRVWWLSRDPHAQTYPQGWRRP